MYDMHTCADVVKVGNGDMVSLLTKGSVSIQDAETREVIHRHNVYYAPQFTKNVSSMSQLIDDGVEVIIKPDAILLKKHGRTVSCP